MNTLGVSAGVIEPQPIGLLVVATCTLETLPWKAGSRYRITAREQKPMILGGPWRWFYGVDDDPRCFVLAEMFQVSNTQPA